MADVDHDNDDQVDDGVVLKFEGFPHKFCSPSGHFHPDIASKGSRCKERDFMTLVI